MTLNTTPSIGVIGAKHGIWAAREVRRLESRGLCTLAALYRRSDEPFTKFYAEMKKENLPDTPVKECRDSMRFFECTTLDAVVIVSPNSCHANHASDALFRGLDVYLEKPLLWNPAKNAEENRTDGRQLLDEAAASKLVFGGGTQWSAVFKDTSANYYSVTKTDPSTPVNSVHMAIATGREKPIEATLIDLLPHPLGVLRTVAGHGRFSSITIEQTGTYAVNVTGIYERKDAAVEFSTTLDTTPNIRSLELGINGRIVTRVAHAGPPYECWLTTPDNNVLIDDPLTTSLRAFVMKQPINGITELRDTHELLCDVMKAYFNISTTTQLSQR